MIYFGFCFLIGQLTIICSSTALHPGRKVQTIKDLEKPWAALTPQLLRPASPTPVDSKLQPTPSSPKWEGHSAATTLLLDDSHAKAALQPYNHLCIPEYSHTQRKADHAMLQHERATQGQRRITDLVMLQLERANSGTTTHTNAHDRVSSPDSTSTTTEAEQGNKRKRKKKKVKKHEQQQLAATADGGASPAVFDETLLAVIGILHAARLQCSIAGWLHADALSLPPPLSERGSIVETWCDDPVLVRAWASCGREALHELGLKVEHGVKS